MKSRILKMVLGIVLLPLLMGGCYYYHDDYEPVILPGTLIVENHSSATDDIWYAYVTESSSPSWGDDLLGSNILQPGDQLVLDIYYCNDYYDILVEYSSGLQVVQYDQWVPCYKTTIVSFVDY